MMNYIFVVIFAVAKFVLVKEIDAEINIFKLKTHRNHIQMCCKLYFAFHLFGKSHRNFWNIYFPRVPSLLLKKHNTWDYLYTKIDAIAEFLFQKLPNSMKSTDKT
jgi:hypothetical protein